MIRDNVTTESLAKLSPAFERVGKDYRDYIRIRYPQISKLRHVHHAGNSSGIADGAAAVLIGKRTNRRATRTSAQSENIINRKRRGRSLHHADGAGSGHGKALARAGLTVGDIDLFEVNEAFASVVLYFMEKTKSPIERINVDGGAIAMGHPVGATGAVLIGTLVNEMHRRDVEHGVVTMCTGLGMGVATVVQRV